MPTTAKGTPYVVSTDLVANYPTVSSDLADHIDDNLTYNAQDINAQTGTTYTFVLADATLYKLVTATNAAASTYTVPPQSSVTWVAGAVLRILNQGAGAVTLTPGSGVTLNGVSLVLSQYQYAELHRTASNTWTVTGIATPPGLEKITDSTFSAAATVSVNNCFTSIYENYRIVVKATGTEAALAGLRMRMRLSGTDSTATNYLVHQMVTSNAGGPTRTYAAADTFGTLGPIGDSLSSYVFDVTCPNQAEWTRIHCVGFGIGTVNNEAGLYSTVHYLSTAYDGFTLYPSTGTFTGNVRVYGYRN